MTKLIECIPNFSDGRNQKVIDGLVEIAKNVKGVTLLDHSSDTSHNRSVFTLVGDEEGIQEVVFQLVKFASENIDMTKHQGEHPRMGQQMWFLLCRSKMSPWKSALLFLRK